ncbi:MAG TPA: phosphoribosylglycinamide formyltransferase [Chloroflexota bacterium]|nr:phosphoribosylglycinamide formyltransferase [Chloroflexota bacterium]
MEDRQSRELGVPPSSSPLRLGILVSGRGSNMMAIVRAIEAGELQAQVALVVCNHGDAPGLAWARERGVPTALFERRDYPSREAQNAAMALRLADAGVELVAMAGYDRLITGELFRRFEGRIVNIHPSLLPAFGGTLHAQADALEYGAKVSGCTVHFVTEGTVDGGPIIIQAAVPVLEGDTSETLAARILEQEHRIYPRAIQLFAGGRLRVVGRRVFIAEGDDVVAG